jgi:predicted ATPase/class 3 adenylate cyclase
MKCPKCEHDNREGVKFCEKCGAKMEFVCPNCAAKIPLGTEFCGECGSKVSQPLEPPPKELSFDEKLEKIQRYLPKGLTKKILSQKNRIEGERKQVTVMFCDMQGFTALSEKLGIEEAYSIIDQVYEILIHKVHDYEGTVNEMTGDGIMALFGAPIALEDAPQRAIRSAYAIHREMARFSNRIKEEKEGIPPLKMRVGIHTGPVVVGTLGNDLRVEFKAVGNTVNLASRMEGLAEPGTTYVTEDTFKLTEGFFRFEALGEKEVKGKKQPISVYRVIAPSTRRTRFDVSAERGLTPFIGRDREVDLLLDAFARAKAGRGQAISIMSEAGVGKSRLLYEFRKAVANEDVIFLEGKCLSYSRGVAYHPVTDILKSNFNVQKGEEDSDIREKVRNGLKVLGADEATTLPYLLELLSVKDSGIDKIMMSPEGRKDRIIEALKRIVLKGSKIRPLIMSFEDLHWTDKSSEEVLKYVLESIPGSRVLLLLTYRPEFVHTWGAKSYHSQVMLNRLSNRESLGMVTHLLGTEDLDENLEGLILEKSEGVPFFIEEFIRSLMDLKIIERADGKYHLARDIREVTVPSTIQDMIMARVDSLPEGAKKVLQTGSVIEREFSYELIKRVTVFREQELLSHLSVLKDAELLYERGVYPESTYIFKHALTREVVYDSILTKRKKQLHEEVGNATEELYEKNIEGHYGILVEHYVAGDNHEKGALYSKLAGRRAEKSASFLDAIAYARKRVDCIEKLPRTKAREKHLIDARTTLGLYTAQLNYFTEAKQAIDPIINLASKHGYKKRLAQIYTIAGTYNYFVEEDFSKAFENLEKAIDLSEQTGDLISFVLANYWLGCALSISCEFEKAYNHMKKALDINERAKSHWGISVMKSNISLLCYNLQGRIDLGHQTSSESLRIAEDSGDIYSMGMANTCHGISCFYMAVLEEAKKNLLKGAKLCEKINLPVWTTMAHQFLAKTYFEVGEYQESIDHSGKAIQDLEQHKLFPSMAIMSKIGIARAKVINKEEDINLESLYGYYHENRFKQYEGWLTRFIGEILLEIDNQHMPEAEIWIKKAIEADRSNGMMFNLGKDFTLYSKLFRRKGDILKAKENLAKAIEIFKECGADGWVEKYEKELTEL